jgi:metallo-beta-lactamase family protein
MCNAGRILHHLRHNLSDPKTTVMFVGFQAEGSLGRKLSDGAKTVKIWGEEIEVNAKIAKMGGLSAHAGQSDLMKWFAAIAASKPGLILTHGENEARNCLSGLIEEQYGIKALLPEMGETIEI